MKPYPLNQLDTQVDRSVLAMIEGTISNIYSRREGTNDKGLWSVQDLMISADGVQVKLKIWGKPEISQFMQGRRIAVKANIQEGKTPTGLFVEDDTYQGKTTRQLRSTASAVIQISKIVDDSTAPEEEPPQLSNPEPTHEPTPPKPTVTEASRKAARASKDAEGIRSAKSELMKLVNLHVLATLAVEKVLAPEYKKATDREMPEDRRGAAVSSLIIAGEKRGLHLGLPARPLKEGEA